MGIGGISMDEQPARPIADLPKKKGKQKQKPGAYEIKPKEVSWLINACRFPSRCHSIECARKSGNNRVNVSMYQKVYISF